MCIRDRVDAAKTGDEIEAAKTDGINAMAAVEKKAAEDYGTVAVTVTNDTYEEGPFTGTFVKETIPLEASDTMMTAILKALEKNGFTWNGGRDYTTTYIGSIEKEGGTLAEFGNGRYSGWTGFLNDWYTNEGFQAFTVAEGEVVDLSLIHI